MNGENNSQLQSANAPFIKIMAWNANGISKKVLELRAAIDFYEVDLVLLSETWLRPGDTLSSQL